MKTINVTFDDVEIEEIEKVKDDIPWRIYILALTRFFKRHSHSRQYNKKILEDIDGRLK